MKRSFLTVAAAILLLPGIAFAAETVKLPYAAGERFVVTTGYDTPPTHIKKDNYAIDLTQDGCDAYGKPAVASFSGIALVVEESGYDGGYGTQLLILGGGNVVARYAHLIPGSIPFSAGDAIAQGTIVGEIGDTGLVMGTACGAHPGTHIHFAMDTENADGSFMAKDPEPISGYTGVVEGKWYVSDNVLAATKGNLAALIEIVDSLFGSGTTVVAPSNSANAVATSSVSLSQTMPQQAAVPVPSSSPRSMAVLVPADSSSFLFCRRFAADIFTVQRGEYQFCDSGKTSIINNDDNVRRRFRSRRCFFRIHYDYNIQHYERLVGFFSRCVGRLRFRVRMKGYFYKRRAPVSGNSRNRGGLRRTDSYRYCLPR